MKEVLLSSLCLPSFWGGDPQAHLHLVRLLFCLYYALPGRCCLLRTQQGPAGGGWLEAGGHAEPREMTGH